MCVRLAINLAHSALKHDVTAVTTINFCMGSVAIMTYSWCTLSYWPDKQYWLIEKASALSWQPEVMVGGNGVGDGEGCSLSFELYCCYRFPIRKKNGPLYWPTTSMKVCLNHTEQQWPSFPSAFHHMVQFSDCALCVCLACVTSCLPVCAPKFTDICPSPWQDCVWDGRRS